MLSYFYSEVRNVSELNSYMKNTKVLNPNILATLVEASENLSAGADKITEMENQVKSLLKDDLNSLTSFTTFVSNLPNLSVIFDSLIFFDKDNIQTINIIINKIILLYSK